MSESTQEKTLKFLTNPLGASLALTLILVVIYFFSVSVCAIPNVIRFFLLTFVATAIVLYVNNYYLLNNFKMEPYFKEKYNEFVDSFNKTKPSE